LVSIVTEGIIITIPGIMENIDNKKEITGITGGIGKRKEIENMTTSGPLILQVTIESKFAKTRGCKIFVNWA